MQIYSRNFSRTTTHRLYEWLFFCISYIYKTANESYRLSISICSNICPKSIYPTCPPLAKLPNRANESSATSAAEAMAGDEQIYVSVYTFLNPSTHPSSSHWSPRLSRDIWQQNDQTTFLPFWDLASQNAKPLCFRLSRIDSPSSIASDCATYPTWRLLRQPSSCLDEIKDAHFWAQSSWTILVFHQQW